MSKRDRDTQSVNDPDVHADEPELGARPIRSPLQAAVRLVLGAVSLGVLALLVWALLRWTNVL